MASATDTLRFVLDGEVIELSDVDPTRTVLEFLREDLRRTGTKEGCREGDCGACTVAIAELDRGRDGVTIRAINSCIQFVPTLDGKELITVESLTADGGGLHPVQAAMVECHGSQCGFCTPGFVMSLFALYKTATSPTRRQIDDALAGNLCRCTGYRPIIAAAQKMYDNPDRGGEPDADCDWLRLPYGRDAPPTDRVEKLRSIDRKTCMTIANGGRRFHAPVTSAELVSLIASTPSATILAGGTDVGLWVTKAHQDLADVIYTGRVAELTRTRAGDTHLEIGAAVTLSDAMPVILEHFPELEELLLRYASPPIRNAATLGGNIANGSPIGDSMPALMALQASLVLRSTVGAREIPLDEFYKGYRVNDLSPGEFVETIRIPRRPDGMTLRSYKISKRFDQDISAVCAAFALTLDGERVASMRVAYGGMAATVKRARSCERSLAGKAWSESNVKQAMQALASDFAPIDDMRSTADYRLRVARNLLFRLFLETRGEVDGSVYAYGRAG